MQSDDGKMMKFMISFEALWTLVSEEVVMHECLRALDAQTTIFVVLVSAWRSNLFESPKALSAQHTIFVERNAPRRLHEQLNHRVCKLKVLYSYFL